MSALVKARVGLLVLSFVSLIPMGMDYALEAEAYENPTAAAQFEPEPKLFEELEFETLYATNL
ncbi:hypothetical protein [Vibrio sp. D431a]|uniref:hypothetical protein n=1 Tax=Vibrio sp. D431a TaxID=2837388 RepID=UPI0025534CE9|nr:hypothetical protein [Vibrio sp. D431a]MDK9790164.1 hypothetical protein [Vibrio sp. D431a]